VPSQRAAGPFGAQLRELRENAGFTQEELAAIAGLSVHAVSALERGQRRRPQVETVRALSAALDLSAPVRDALNATARGRSGHAAGAGPGGGWLPLPLTTLVGRDADVQQLQACLVARDARLITLTGPGGVGKTRLALEVARAIAAQRKSRVLFVGLGPIRTSALVGPAIAEALGILDASPRELPQRARTACDGIPTLLVLDNFEQVLDAAPLVAELLAAVVSLTILATSRAPLHVRGEREYALGPLALETNAEALPLADLAQCPAVRLFVDRVRDAQPQFQLTSANVVAVTEICRRLDALPLALELAAPWIKVLTPEDLLQQLARDVLLSPVGARDLPERQRTINATVAWSYQLLDPAERQVFRRFGALPGRFSIEAAAAVLGGRNDSARALDALGGAAGLIDKSLLVRGETPSHARPMFHMLETVRAYAALELTEAGELDEALAGLARYCATQADLAAQELFGPDQAGWLDRVRDDLDSYRAALGWLIERGRGADAANIAWGLMYFWVIRGHAIEGLQWYEQVLKLQHLPAVPESRALVGAAMMWYSLGEVAHAMKALTRALQLAHDAGDAEMIAQAEHLLGHVEHALGNAAAARRRLARSAATFRELAIPWGVGNSLNGLAKVAMLNGDAVEADRLLDEAASVLRDSSPWFMALVSFRRATIAVQRGDADEALAMARESLALFRQLNDTFAIVYALAPLAAAAALKGDDLWTARILGARDAIMERTGANVVDKWVRALGEGAERDVRARLAPDRWTRAYAAGRVASIDSLLIDLERRAEGNAGARRRAPDTWRGSRTALAD
jgi:predicted ATPase/DNA-binding XRE family transcriptional regulator